MTDRELEDFIDAAYRATFRRQPDNGGRKVYVDFMKLGHSPTDVLNSLLRSDEFRRTSLVDTPAEVHLPAPDPELSFGDGCKSLTDALQGRVIVSSETFEQVAAAALADVQRYLGGQDSYLRYHHRRFFEIVNISLLLLQNHQVPPPAAILDFGFSVNSCILRRLLPNATVAVCDRPQISSSRELGFATYTVDLVDDALEDTRLGSLFDLIVFAEVIEHVLVNPVRILRFLLRHLRPGGRLILTTPNFFRRENRIAFAAGRNPLPIYPMTYRRSDAPHFHVREYTARELLEALSDAGGRALALLYSDCWDETDAPQSRDALGNLVLIAAA